MIGEPPTKLITWNQLRELYGITLSRDSARRLWRAGRFPVPVRLGLHHLAWNAASVERYLANLPSADAAPIRRGRK